METNTLENHFLIATPSLKDPNFSKSVILLYEHNDQGAMGLIINKPLHINLGSIFEHLEIESADDTIANHPILMGGPIGPEQGFVIHEEIAKLDKTTIEHQIIISGSREILSDIAQGEGPKDFLVALGYASWGPGQLEKEIHNGDWLLTAINTELLFHTAAKRLWKAVAKDQLGIDITQMSQQTGHA